jgi:hypothetical protein
VSYIVWPLFSIISYLFTVFDKHNLIKMRFGKYCFLSGKHCLLFPKHFLNYYVLYCNNILLQIKQVQYPQLLEIVNKYHPEIIWSDGVSECFNLYLDFGALFIPSRTKKCRKLIGVPETFWPGSTMKGAFFLWSLLLILP